MADLLDSLFDSAHGNTGPDPLDAAFDAAHGNGGASPASGAQLTGAQKFAGGIANMIPFTIGDELMAGIRGIVDVAQGNPWQESYDSNLGQIRDYQKAFTTEHPVLAPISSIAGSAPVIVSVPTGISPQMSIFEKMGQAAIEGAGWGGAYGFGAGEGGLENRTLEGAKQALFGEVAGPAGVLVGAGIEKGANALKEASQSFARKSVGARYSDYLKTANDLGIADLPDGSLQTLTKTSLNDAIEKGELGKSTNPEKMLGKVRNQLENLREKVGGVISAYDESGAPPVYPNFDKTLDFLTSGKVPADKLEKYASRLTKLDEGIREQGKGSLQFLQQQKIAVGKDFNPADKTEASFVRSLYYDLQKAIEGAVPEVGTLNKELQKFEVIEPILKSGLAKYENQTAASRGFDLIKTTGGVGSALIVGSQLGSPLTAGVGAAGYLLGATPLGQKTTSNVLSGVSKAASLAAKPIENFGGRFASQLLSANQTDSSLAEKSRPGVQELLSRPKANATTYQPRIQGSIGQEAQGKEKPLQESQRLSSSDPNSIFALSQEKGSVFFKVLNAVKEVESGGKSDSISSAGAKGPYQLMDATGKEYHKKLGISEAYDPFNEKQARVIAAAYIADLLAEFGDLKTALTAYNQGPGNVKKGKIGPVGRRYADSVFSKLEV